MNCNSYDNYASRSHPTTLTITIMLQITNHKSFCYSHTAHPNSMKYLPTDTFLRINLAISHLKKVYYLSVNPSPLPTTKKHIWHPRIRKATGKALENKIEEITSREIIMLEQGFRNKLPSPQGGWITTVMMRYSMLRKMGILLDNKFKWKIK